MRRLGLAAVSLVAALAVATAASARVDPLSPASGPTPFNATCGGPGQEGTLFVGAEVEPFVDVNPTNSRNVIGVWQQDRWSNGGANGDLTGVSGDGGRTWTRPTPPPFSRCAGGNPQNGGDYARASDPWVAFSPNGDAHQIALSLEAPDAGPNAVLVSSSRNGGASWEPIKTLIRDTDGSKFLNDKEAITADPSDSRFIYAVWDRLASQDLGDPLSEFFGPTYFARSTDGGRSFEPARAIFDPGVNNQTIANQIVVLPNGRLVNVFTLIRRGIAGIAAIFSDDRGRTWSTRPVIIDLLGAIGVEDPRDGAPVRTGDVTPDVAVDRRSGRLYVVWQDARFNAFERDQIAFARSSSGGRSWTRPKRISSNNRTQAFLASVDVNRRGKVAVTYHDLGRDTPQSTTLDTDYWTTRSSDGGKTFSRRERITPRPFDMRSAPFARGFFVGDYLGLASKGRRFRSLFVQTNAGNTGNPTDLFSTTIRGASSGRSFRGSRSRRKVRGAAAAGRHLPARPLNGRVRPYRTP